MLELLWFMQILLKFAIPWLHIFSKPAIRFECYGNLGL